MDRGLLYGEACFETVRVIDGGIFCWQEHLSRLQGGLDGFGIDLPENLLSRCLEAAALQGEDVLLRLTVSGGAGPWGFYRQNRKGKIHIMTRCYNHCAPVSLRSVQWPFPLRDKPAKFSADYAEALRAFQIVRHRMRGDDESILICDDDCMISAMTANLLVYRNGSWWTPAGSGILPGVVRGALLQSGVMTEARCPHAWTADCQAMAICNSGAFITPVCRINGRKLAVDGGVYDCLWQVLAGKPGVPV